MSGALKRRDVLVGAVASAAALCVGDRALAGSITHEVRIKGFTFEPAQVEVRIGDTIRWINDDLAPHTATADKRGWDTGSIAQNQSADIRVTADMEVTYFCVFHPHMKAEIVMA